MEEQSASHKDGRCSHKRRGWQAQLAADNPLQYCWNFIFTREEREACFLFYHKGCSDELFKAFVLTHRSTWAVKLGNTSPLRTFARDFGLYLHVRNGLRHDELLTNPDDWTVWNSNMFVAEFQTIMSIVDLNKKGVTPSTEMMVRIYEEFWPEAAKGLSLIHI